MKAFDIVNGITLLFVVAGCSSISPGSGSLRVSPPVSLKEVDHVAPPPPARNAKYCWYEPNEFLLLATQHLIKTGMVNIIEKAKQQSVWVNDDEMPIEVIVVFHWVFPKGPKGPQDYMVRMSPFGKVIDSQPSYSTF